MTERALPLDRDDAPQLPASALSAPQHPASARSGPRLLPDRPTAPGGGPAARTRVMAIPAVVARPGVATRRPVHVAVAVGVSAGLYAISLAGVTALQAGTDGRLAADRAPAAAAVDALRSSHDALDADLARIDAGYSGAAAAYQRIAGEIAGHEASLAGLVDLVTSVEGSAASLKVPVVSRLPAVSSRTVYVSSKPATNACTTASGKPC